MANLLNILYSFNDGDIIPNLDAIKRSSKFLNDNKWLLTYKVDCDYDVLGGISITIYKNNTQEYNDYIWFSFMNNGSDTITFKGSKINSIILNDDNILIVKNLLNTSLTDNKEVL